jgi:ATP-binding cassette subfamily B protein
MKELIAGVATVYMKKNEAAQFFDLMELPEQKADGTECGGIEVVQADDVKYRYPLTERYVLDGVSLTIRKGEKVAFVGENGMGKTTFVKLITGTLSPSEGALLISGVDIQNVNPISHYNEISAVVQDPARYNAFTVADNVFFFYSMKQREGHVPQV